MQEILWRYAPEGIALTLVLFMQRAMYRWALDLPELRESPQRRRRVRAVYLFFMVWVVSCLLMGAPVVRYLVPPAAGYWVRGTGLAWVIACAGLFAVAVIWRLLPPFQPGRREVLRVAQAATFAVPVAVTGFGVFIERRNHKVAEIDARIPDLPRDLNGVRILQVSDIHLSPYLSERELERLIDLSNELRPHLVAITGDLITRSSDPLDACLRQLGRLRSDAGMVGCLGNHEVYASTEDYTTREGAKIGINFLRNASKKLRFGSSVLNVVGVDYQSMRKPYLVGADRLVDHAAVNLLLSHNPDVFPTAARQGFDLTLAGHTHGGQVNFEILHQQVNVARFFTPYTYGLFEREGKLAYVTRGIGTVGVPARIGAPPELAVVRLCAI